MSNLKTRAYRGVLWQFCGVSLSTVLSIGYMMIMGRLLEPAAFGEFALVMVVVSIAQIVTQFGFGPALVYRKELSEEHISFVFLATTAIGIAACGVVYLAAPAISHLYDLKIRVSLLQVAAVALVLSTIGTTSKFLLTRDLQFDRIFWADTLSFLLGNMLVGIGMALYGFQAWALLGGILVSRLISNALLLWFRPFRIRLSIKKPDAGSIVSYGSGLLLVQLLNQVAAQLDKVIIGQVGSLSLVGAYERSQRIQNLPISYLGNSVDGVAFSVLAKYSDQRRLIGEYFFPFIALVSLISMYFAVYAFLFAAPLVRVILGEGWDEAVSVLQAVALLIFVQTFPRFTDTLVRATKAFTTSARIKLVFVIAMLVFALLGNSVYGFSGAVLGIVASNMVHAGLMTWLSLKITGSGWRVFIRAALPVFLFAIVTFVKGCWLLSLAAYSPWQHFVAVVLTDVVFFAVFVTSPALVGNVNARFISDRLQEISALAGLSKLYDRCITR